MIIVEVSAQAENAQSTNVCRFECYMNQVDRPFNLKNASSYFERYLQPLEREISISVDNNILTASYKVDAPDPENPYWKQWYIKVVDALKEYLDKNKKDVFWHEHEVLSRLSTWA